MAVAKQTNRKCLDPHEIEALDTAMETYDRAKKAAFVVYTALLVEARKERDDRIVEVIKAGRRSTTARIAEHIKMTYTAVGDMRRRYDARHATQTA